MSPHETFDELMSGPIDIESGAQQPGFALNQLLRHGIDGVFDNPFGKMNHALVVDVWRHPSLADQASRYAVIDYVWDKYHAAISDAPRRESAYRKEWSAQKAAMVLWPFRDETVGRLLASPLERWDAQETLKNEKNIAVYGLGLRIVGHWNGSEHASVREKIDRAGMLQPLIRPVLESDSEGKIRPLWLHSNHGLMRKLADLDARGSRRKGLKPVLRTMVRDVLNYSRDFRELVDHLSGVNSPALRAVVSRSEHRVILERAMLASEAAILDPDSDIETSFVGALGRMYLPPYMRDMVGVRVRIPFAALGRFSEETDYYVASRAGNLRGPSEAAIRAMSQGEYVPDFETLKVIGDGLHKLHELGVKNAHFAGELRGSVDTLWGTLVKRMKPADIRAYIDHVCAMRLGERNDYVDSVSGLLVSLGRIPEGLALLGGAHAAWKPAVELLAQDRSDRFTAPVLESLQAIGESTPNRLGFAAQLLEARLPLPSLVEMCGRELAEKALDVYLQQFLEKHGDDASRMIRGYDEYDQDLVLEVVQVAERAGYMADDGESFWHHGQIIAGLLNSNLSLEQRLALLNQDTRAAYEMSVSDLREVLDTIPLTWRKRFSPVEDAYAWKLSAEGSADKSLRAIETDHLVGVDSVTRVLANLLNMPNLDEDETGRVRTVLSNWLQMGYQRMKTSGDLQPEQITDQLLKELYGVGYWGVFNLMQGQRFGDLTTTFSDQGVMDAIYKCVDQQAQRNS